MKWVRLLQLSQTLGVNDIITAFSKHKPAYAFLLPPLQNSLCSVNPQKLWAASASASAIQTTALPFARVDHCHQRHSLPLAVGLKQQFVNLTETGRWQWADSSWEIEGAIIGRIRTDLSKEVCNYPNLNQTLPCTMWFLTCHRNMWCGFHSSWVGTNPALPCHSPLAETFVEREPESPTGSWHRYGWCHIMTV